MHEEIPVLWSENLQIPFCDYCLSGKKCNCGSAEAEECDYCDSGCDCGFEQLESGEVCSCECECEEDEDGYGGGEDGNCSECCICSYPIKDDLPEYCYCECKCTPCICKCSCPYLVIDADSYNHWIAETCYVCPPGSLAPQYLDRPVSERRFTVPLGQGFEFFIRTLPPTQIHRQPLMPGLPMIFAEPSEIIEYETPTYIDVVQNGYKSRVRFTGPVLIPMVGEHTPYRDEPRVWMGLTPMEIFTQMPGVELAAGRVLIGGLGMGWLTNRVLQKPEVEEVVQVELKPEILDFFGKPLLDMYPGRITLVQDDVYNFLEQAGLDQFDTILLDIWPKYTGARRDSQFRALKKAHPRVWGWGEKPLK